MQKARRHHINAAPTACKRMVSGSISPSCSEYFSPFPHGTCSLSVSQEYLALPDGAGRFNRDFSCPGLLRIPASQTKIPVRDSHPLRSAFPCRSRLLVCNHAGPTTPSLPKQSGFGLIRVRSPLLSESLLFSPPVGT